MVLGWISSSRNPGRVSLATLSTLSRSTWPVVSGGLGRSSNSRASASATANGHRQQQSPPVDEAQRELGQIVQRVHLGAGQLEGPADSPGAGEQTGNGVSHILHMNGLQPGVAS